MITDLRKLQKDTGDIIGCYLQHLVSTQAFHLRKEEGENEFKGFDEGR